MKDTINVGVIYTKTRDDKSCQLCFTIHLYQSQEKFSYDLIDI